MRLDCQHHANGVHDPLSAAAPTTAAPTTAAGCAMNDILSQLAIFLLLPAAVAAWKHSRIVSTALVWPLVASLATVVNGTDLAIEHPARLWVPFVSMLLGFAEVYAEGKYGDGVSRALLLGALVVASGMADLAQLPAFKYLEGWAVPPLQILGCFGIIAVSTLPKRRIPWLTSLFS